MKEPAKTEDKKILGLFRPKFGSRAIYEESSASESTKIAREEIPEADYSLIKIILIIVGISFLAFLFSYSFFAWGIFFTLSAGILFVSITALLPLLLKSPGLHFAAGLVSSAAITAPLYFFGGISLIPVVVLAIASTGMLTEGMIYGKKELDNSLKASLSKFSRRIMARTLTVIALVVAISYGWNFKVEDLSSDRFIDGTLSFSAPIIDYYVPGFTPEMNFGEFLEIFANQALAKESAANFILMPEAAKLKLVNQTVENLHRFLENDLAINVNLDASFKENFRKAVAEKLAKPIATMNPEHVAITAVTVIFIFVRGILWLLGWLALAFAFLILQLLLVTKFARMYFESRTREIILLK